MFGETFDENPRKLLSDGDFEMVRLWRAAHPPAGRIAGMAGGIIPVTGHLPESGGYGEQAAVMLDAFDAMSAAEAELERGSGSREL